MRRGVRARGAMVLVVVSIAGCAGSRQRPAAAVAAPPAVAPAAAPVTPEAFSRLEDAEPQLLALEDRRAFDAATLTAAAGSSDARVRARTALSLGRIGDERAAGLLHGLLADSSAAVRNSAAFGSGILSVAALTVDLAPLLGDSDAEVAARAAWSLGFLEQSAGQDALQAGIRGAASADLRVAMLRALWRFPNPAAAATLMPYATDADPRLRIAALYALARRPQESSLAVLTAALGDADVDTAALAARALGVLGKPESLGPLCVAIDGPRGPVVINAAAAAEAILEKNPGTKLPAEKDARLLTLAGDSNPNLAIPALTLLRWRVEDREVFRRLWAVASAGRERRQQVALQSLMSGLGARSESLVDTAITSPDPFLRAAVAESLSFLPQADAAPLRDALAADPEVVVRLKVLDGLQTADAVRANRALVDQKLADPDSGVRAAAIDALGQLDDPSTMAILREAVTKSYADREPDVPIAAIGVAQARPEVDEARSVVQAAYGHPSTLVSRLARRSLVRHFHVDPATLPWREYVTGKTAADYQALFAQSRLRKRARIETDRGAFTVALAMSEAPMTAMNFVGLAGKAFFAGARIHRVVPGFVVQDGDPTGTGNGGPGYEIRDEINPIPYTTATVGMALSGPDTGGSQWFVTQAPQPHLDGLYTVFGRVIDGMDVVMRIEQGDRIARVTISEGGS